MKSHLNRVIAPLIVLAQLLAAPATALAEADAPSPQTTARATLHVDGMIGETCPVLIESALKRMDGVHHVKASYPEHKATVDYDPQRIGLDQIRKRIREAAGFDTELAH